MRRRRAFTEKQTRNQAATASTAPVTREVSAARIKSTKRTEIPIGRNVAVATENATGALPEIGNDNDIGFIVSCAGLDPCFPLAHVIGSAEICVPVGASDFQAAEFVDQEDVDLARARVARVDRRVYTLDDV